MSIHSYMALKLSETLLSLYKILKLFFVNYKLHVFKDSKGDGIEILLKNYSNNAEIILLICLLFATL